MAEERQSIAWVNVDSQMIKLIALQDACEDEAPLDVRHLYQWVMSFMLEHAVEDVEWGIVLSSPLPEGHRSLDS